LPKREDEMAVAKVIEVIAESDSGWEDAARKAVIEASETVHNIKSLWVEGMQAIVEGDAIVKYRLNAKVTFVVRDSRD
jgi:flavin-binding protein dodecin